MPNVAQRKYIGREKKIDTRYNARFLVRGL